MLDMTRKQFLTGLGVAAFAAVMPSAAKVALAGAGSAPDDAFFQHHYEQLNGRRQHFVTAGSGKAVSRS